MGDLTVSEVLSKAADLLEKPGAWTQGAFSRDKKGSVSTSDDRFARGKEACWCLRGAIAKVLGSTDRAAEGLALVGEVELASALGLADQCLLVAWNDKPERTQAEVVAALRQASKLSEGVG